MTEEILKRFDKRFPYKIAGVIDDFGDETKADIQAFIKTEIESLEAKHKAEVEKMLGKLKFENGCNCSVCLSHRGHIDYIAKEHGFDLLKK